MWEAAVQVFTYNGQDWGEEDHATQGGYSNTYTIDSKCADPMRFLVLGFRARRMHIQLCVAFVARERRPALLLG